MRALRSGIFFPWTMLGGDSPPKKLSFPSQDHPSREFFSENPARPCQGTFMFLGLAVFLMAKDCFSGATRGISEHTLTLQVKSNF